MKTAALGWLLCLLATGCAQQEADDAPAPDAPRLTKSQLIKQGDAICRAGNRRLDAAVESRLGPRSTPAQVRAFVRKVALPELEAQVAALRELQPPLADVPRIDLMLDAVEEAIEETEEEPIKALRQDAAFDRANRIARKYGFKACSE